MASISALVHAGLLHEDVKKKTYADNQLWMTFPGWLVPSERGRREVGLWPSEETALDLIVKQLEIIAGNTGEDEDTRTRAKRVLDGLLESGQALGLSVAAAVVSGVVT